MCANLIHSSPHRPELTPYTHPTTLLLVLLSGAVSAEKSKKSGVSSMWSTRCGETFGCAGSGRRRGGIPWRTSRLERGTVQCVRTLRRVEVIITEHTQRRE